MNATLFPVSVLQALQESLTPFIAEHQPFGIGHSDEQIRTHHAQPLHRHLPPLRGFQRFHSN